MKKKRTFLVALAMVLVCILSITGTFAYLTHTAPTVNNTFVAAGGGQLIDPDGVDNQENTDDDGAFLLEEHVVSKVMNGETWTGKYEIAENAATTQENDYEIMPGMVVPKDPYVTIKAKTSVPAYLYVEVINELGFDTKVNGQESLVVDPDNWLEIDTTGKNGGKVYVYTAGGTGAALVTADVTNVNILKDNRFIVNEDVEAVSEDSALKFNAYLAQASIGSSDAPADVFTACFGK